MVEDEFAQADSPQERADSDTVLGETTLEEDLVAKSDKGEELDEQHLILKRLLLAHEAWFNVTRDYYYGGLTFPGYAEFHSHGEKYVLVKRAKLWEVDAHEYLFFAIADALSAEDAETWISFMKSEAFKKVEPKENHMTSYISLVVVANSVDDQAAKLFRKTRFHKEFKFGTQGWVDMRLAAIDVENKKVYTNGMGKEMEPQLNSALGLPAKKKLFRR